MGRSILPTAEADTLYPRALSILDDLKQLEEEIVSTGKSVAGELIIGASTIPGTYLLPKLAASFKNKYPDISFEIKISDSAKIVRAVQNNELLIGFVGAKIPAKKVTYQPFVDDELILVAAKDNPVPDTITLDQLCKLPFIMRENGSGTRKTIEAALAEHQINTGKLHICATLGSSAAVKEAIIADLGVSFVSRYAVQQELEGEKVKEIRTMGVSMKRTFFIVTLTKRTLPHCYNTFLKNTNPS